MFDALTTSLLEIPFDGLSDFSGLGFALDQYARHCGFHSFAELSAALFSKGFAIAGHVSASDDLEPPKQVSSHRIPASFGYQAQVWPVSLDGNL